MFRRYKRVHFVGIGGIGMSGIAEVLLNLGYYVSGSDLKRSRITERLAKLGAKITYDHKPENIEGADVVVYSSAVSLDNPELMAAKERQIPVIPRAEMLGELMRMKFSVAVAGSHGKTSTTSMIAVVLNEAGLDPTIVIGGRLNIIGSSAKLGRGDLLVAEADESDGSFLKLFPTIAVVTSIDKEHLDYYHDLEDIKRAFVDFVNKVPFYGTGILCLDEVNVQSIIPLIYRRKLTYGMSSQADLMAGDVEIKGFSSQFSVFFRGERLGELKLRVPGYHSVYNALAAVAVGLDLEIPFDTIKRALEVFSGADRRLEKKGEVKGILVLDDYGHHPTEIKVTLRAVKEGWGRRLIVVFQPHRYTRTKFLLDEFGRSFYQADKVIVSEIYPAGEKPIPGITGELIAEKIREFGHKGVIYVPELKDIPKLLLDEVEKGDIVLTLGAGNVYKVGEEFLTLLKGEEDV
ncbi:MAG: UDP-N-acetylmuramate--L-alanine ligase [Acidobacteria bacterium]|nr:UDP-N-acetylmuramate--L-alanine ligase [Acidobacteriota bacterium]